MSPGEPPLEMLHGLTFEPKKRRHRMKLSIARGRKLVARRVCVDIPTTDFATAALARDAVLKFAERIGLVIVRRFQRRPGPVPAVDEERKEAS